MAFPLHPRAKVRLRMEGATALLRRPGATSLLCALADLSEEGCRCRVSMDGVDAETAASWGGVLTKGLVVTLEIGEPPELRGLVFDRAEVRWVESFGDGELKFGLHLSNPKPEQKGILAKALLSFATSKLRRPAKSRAELPAVEEALTEAAAGPGSPQAARPAPGRVFVAEPSTMQLSGIARLRPRRLKVFLPVVYEFCGPDGAEWEQGLHQGRTVDVSEGGIMLEGPAPDFCHPGELVRYKTCAAVTIRAGDHDVKGFCAVRSVTGSRQRERQWLYGMQIIDMSAMDREILYRIFANAEAENR